MESHSGFDEQKDFLAVFAAASQFQDVDLKKKVERNRKGGRGSNELMMKDSLASCTQTRREKEKRSGTGIVNARLCRTKIYLV